MISLYCPWFFSFVFLNTLGIWALKRSNSAMIAFPMESAANIYYLTKWNNRRHQPLLTSLSIVCPQTLVSARKSIGSCQFEQMYSWLEALRNVEVRDHIFSIYRGFAQFCRDTPLITVWYLLLFYFLSTTRDIQRVSATTSKVRESGGSHFWNDLLWKEKASENFVKRKIKAKRNMPQK